jgi:hypothetical protein
MNLTQKALFLIPVVGAIAIAVAVAVAVNFMSVRDGGIEVVMFKGVILKTHTELCKLGSEPQHCDALIKFGIDPMLFQNNKDYEDAIDKKASSNQLLNNKEFHELTHIYAANNGITLSDRYTSRWSEP